MDKQRWQTLMHDLAGQPSLDTYQQLVCAYSEPHRYYHTATHIDACLDHLDRVKVLAQAPAILEMALWFHDAVYQTQSNQNEQDSADWAVHFLQTAGVAVNVCHQVHHLIMATATHTTHDHPDTALMVDIDLAILGQNTQTFADFETQIRQEYAWVPITEYCQQRSQILETFAQRPHLYQTAYFQERYEAMARSNLQTAIRCLQAGILTNNGDNK
ncbi:HD domain-containing protein [Acaryochloris marina]|uniref:N-methyl-D-aspartate receptor NMDAR2C subunit n=1 Tax=Acaryochloris marina (strain MBIC 11017) TaxID=329726 RepID=B0C499_ACAM1|nr:hypothetical protein [Acaryochloris marina]ABW27490.1 conserved hypothetical protein [Acaryochloris marina MBIC11017]BDM82226.1 hypothetical protein AM10699_50900 [Acaryochloris marina MBIC10699]